MEHPVKILKNAEKPNQRTGRRKRWDLPLSDLGSDDVLLIEMSADDARDAIGSVRSAVHREMSRTGVRYHVYLTDEGIKVWPMEADQDE